MQAFLFGGFNNKLDQNLTDKAWVVPDLRLRVRLLVQNTCRPDHGECWNGSNPIPMLSLPPKPSLKLNRNMSPDYS